MKYREDLIEKVRNGEAQIRVDQHEVWNDLLNYTFPLRKQDEVSFVFYSYYDRGVEYLGSNEPRYNMPIIPAKDFLIQESEVNWVEVSDNSVSWSEHKYILLSDSGSQINYRYRCLSRGLEKSYLSGEKGLNTEGFKFIREATFSPEPLTHAEIEKLIGKPFRYVEES